MNDVIRDFFKMESAGGILLVIAAAIAMTIANSPLGETYQSAAYLCIWYVSFSLD
jgi:NhaA family Na+:H+ antiporter